MSPTGSGSVSIPPTMRDLVLIRSFPGSFYNPMIFRTPFLGYPKNKILKNPKITDFLIFSRMSLIEQCSTEEYARSMRQLSQTRCAPHIKSHKQLCGIRRSSLICIKSFPGGPLVHARRSQSSAARLQL